MALLPAPATPDLKRRIESLYRDPAVQVTVPDDLEQGSLRVLSRLLDYLGLIGLVTLSMGWIGVYYLGRRWLTLEMPGAGLLKCLGLSSGELLRLLAAKAALVMVAGILLGGAISWAGARAVFPMFVDSLPPEFKLVWSWKSTALLLLIGPFSGLLLLFEPLRACATERLCGCSILRRT
ncbi:MAG: hypothetical protein HC902_06220 [Calothrix sp. SM1_5_4]|nr:hypothetical protein [Calothrix sp. SM1_5_4]